MATRYNEPIPSQQMSEGILQVVQKKQIRNWQSTTSGFLLDWRNELMASLTCARHRMHGVASWGVSVYPEPSAQRVLFENES